MKRTESRLTDRDLDILRQVAKFRQLSANQIRILAFSSSFSSPSSSFNSTPSDRVLLRLTTAGYLHRIERRLVGGARGGSGQYVYGLGRKGFYTFFTGAYTPARTVNIHALGIADCYIAFKGLEASGSLRILAAATEPDCWTQIEGTELRPDLRIDVALPDNRVAAFWLEVDYGSEGQKQLRGKLEAYWRAYTDSTDAVFPFVVWVAVDDARARELKFVISQMPEDHRKLFWVRTFETLPQLLST